MVSRICEEFGCLPAQALIAIDEDVDNLLFKIIGLRSYSRGKDAYEEGMKEPDLTKRPQSPAIDKVRDIAWELTKEKLAAAKARAETKE